MKRPWQRRRTLYYGCCAASLFVVALASSSTASAGKFRMDFSLFAFNYAGNYVPLLNLLSPPFVQYTYVSVATTTTAAHAVVANSAEQQQPQPFSSSSSLLRRNQRKNERDAPAGGANRRKRTPDERKKDDVSGDDLELRILEKLENRLAEERRRHESELRALEERMRSECAARVLELEDRMLLLALDGDNEGEDADAPPSALFRLASSSSSDRRGTRSLQELSNATTTTDSTNTTDEAADSGAAAEDDPPPPAILDPAADGNYVEAEQFDKLSRQFNKLKNALSCLDKKRSTGRDLYFLGCNVHVENGDGQTVKSNGLGNLILGYNEVAMCPSGNCTRTGSHNLVVGVDNEYSASGGIVAGSQNTITGSLATVTGGYRNVASGLTSSVAGVSYCCISWRRNFHVACLRISLADTYNTSFSSSSYI